VSISIPEKVNNRKLAIIKLKIPKIHMLPITSITAIAMKVIPMKMRGPLKVC
jgi:hypothetical protein